MENQIGMVNGLDLGRLEESQQPSPQHDLSRDPLFQDSDFQPRDCAES